jgi:tetratricopeptide (TPR) repeat protein
MVEKALHAGNIAAAFGIIATTADLSLAAGAGTAIGAALSGTALFRRAQPEEKRFASMMAEAMDAHLAANPLSEDDRTHLKQMLELFPLTADHLCQGDLTASLIASRHRARVSAESKDSGHKTQAILDKFEALLSAMLDPVEKDPATAFEREMLRRQSELLDLARQAGQADRLRNEGITERAIVRLAQRIAEKVEDVGQAWLELQNAMDIAVNVQREGATGTNHAGFVDAVLARVAELSREGANEQAMGEIEEALRREEAESQARRSRLLSSGTEQAILAREPGRAAAFLVRKVELETPDRAAQFAALQGVFAEWYERGRDAGLNFDLEVAIALAREGVARGTTVDERASAANDLGAALWTLGAREANSVRLEEAIASCEAAIQDISRHRAPLLWARAQMNLGNALWSLGSRSAERAILEDAVSAFLEALQEYKRDCAPSQWAKTQMNLGNALWALGSREAGVERVEMAVAAYRAALEEFDLDRFPFEWATAKSNLGIALTTLGEREIGPARFEEAVAAYLAALDVFRRDCFPLKWANTQMNLGTALAQVGQRQGDPKGYERAVVAFRSALSEYTREKAPFDWARIQANLGTALRAAGESDKGTERLEEAVAAFRAALEEYTRETAPLQWAGVQMNLGLALKCLGERQNGTEHLAAADSAYKAALDQWTRERVPLRWAMVHGNLASLSLAFHRKTGDAAHLAAAREHAEAARGVYAEAGAGQYLAQVEGILAEIEALAAAP